MTKVDLHPRSDIASRRHWEDGSPVEYTVWYVVAESENGARWAHRHTFEGRRAPEALVRLMARMEVAGLTVERVSSSEHWVSIDPAYGSLAYGNGAHESLHEARELEAEGYPIPMELAFRAGLM